MYEGSIKRYCGQLPGCRVCLAVVIFTFACTERLAAQTPSTGSVTGIALDQSNAVVPGVVVSLSIANSPQSQIAVSDDLGRFAFVPVRPGIYDIDASKTGFKELKLLDIRVHVTETLRVELHLQLETHVERVQTAAEPLMAQVDRSALGRVVNKTAIQDLPLVTRNFSQIVSLSPGVTAGVSNASELGLGATAQSQIGRSNDGIYVHGSRSYDNNWQLDGISVSDVQSTGATSGGIPIPNPDTLEEFKMQTALYDAAFGRSVGADVSIITKKGSNQYHGTAFEFLRNDVLNANDFFLNRTGHPRPDLKQNQFGFSAGGPILKDRLFLFSSYQGTRQINGLAAGQARIACSASLSEPPLTSDRSAAAIGKLFGGMKGAQGGVAINSDGSNLNPVALTLLNLKLPDGSYLIPNPQTIDPSKPFATQGFSVFSEPCHFNEDQGLFNIDYAASQNNQIAARFFISGSDQTVTFPSNGFNPIGNISGFASPGNSRFVVFSLADTYALNKNSLNEFRIGYVRTQTGTEAEAPFSWSDVGVAESDMNRSSELPSLNILGSVSMAPAFPRTYTQNSFVFGDVFSWLKGVHALRFGGSLTRLQDNLYFAGFDSNIRFLSWADFLLGLDSIGNGTGTFSNVFESDDQFGFFDRQYRAWEGSAFAQDDYRINRTLTLNVGLRYERIGQLGDKLGRGSSFDFSKADPNPPLGGSLDGFTVASNFSGTLPPGVIRASNTFATYGNGQNAIAPRIGFAWQMLPQTSWLTLRGGYGIYYSRPTGQAFAISIPSAPFALARINTGLTNAGATFQAPFQQPFPTPDSFPLFVPYSLATQLSIASIAQDLQPAMVQQFSLNMQQEFHHGWLLEIGYIGTKGTHLQRLRSLNQALDASPSDPVNGMTSNTLANIPLRVPVPGVLPDSLRVAESEGNSWYNGLEVSLTKRLSHGLQLLASYTLSKTEDTDGSETNGISAVNTLTLGNQNVPSQRWGRASIDRPQRFVFSTTWALPSPATSVTRAVLGGWNLSAIATVQSGSALTIAYTNANNVFGISEDRAELSGQCTHSQFVTGGLDSYFNKSCFTNPPIIGADGIGRGFGNSGTGIVDGPGQANLDLAISKTLMLNWPMEKSSLQIRAEFFNALNHPQFSNPDANFSSPTFGVIGSTSVNPRVGQLALRFAF
jgi:TonB dependent receptor/Carboxypeptidase regulatory-like domain